MSAITKMWRQLIERRLWPVAILLIAALAMVPLALAKQPAPEPAPAVVPAEPKSELTETPIVAQVGPTDRTERRRVLGSTKNPFAVTKAVATPTVTPAGSSPSATPPETSGGTSTTSGGGVTTPGAGGTTTPSAPVKKPKVYDLYDLTVRFGDATAETIAPRSTLKRLQPLPSAEEPALIYLGVLKDGKTAVFLIDTGVETTGDGSCKPSVGMCETIEIRAGETEFLDVKDETGVVVAQYELDVVKIHKGATTSAKTARSSYAGTTAGRRLLKARERPGYRLDGATGTIERRSPKAYGAVSRAAVGLR